MNWIDLVFCSRLTRSFVLIALKVGALTPQDLAKMRIYVNYYPREIAGPDENPTIGIVLCTDNSETVVRYTLPENNQRVFASRYKIWSWRQHYGVSAKPLRWRVVCAMQR